MLVSRWFGLCVLSRSSKASEENGRSNIQGKEFLIVDEISMDDKVTAYCLNLSI